jgi:hypothetical protein
MRCAGKVYGAVFGLLTGSMLLVSTTSACAQVSPEEIQFPRPNADEQKYLRQLQSLHQSIVALQFPFGFKLARYPGANPGQKAALDSNGIEFVDFQHRVVLKVSGIYKAAYSSAQLSENERASRTFQEVVTPILRLITQQIPRNADYDGIGFEIVYHTRDANKAYDYEGQEVLTVVLGRDDAFSYLNTAVDEDRQKLLNRSNIFVDGKEFGLALNQRDSFNVQAFERSLPRQAGELPSAAPVNTELSPVITENTVSSNVPIAQSKPASNSTPAPTVVNSGTSPATTPVMTLQAKYEAQLNAMMKEDGAQFNLVESAQPVFERFGDQTVLHLTMQNTLLLDASTTSIYKRAAQSFDLFLAPKLKDLSKKLPADAEYSALYFSVLNNPGAARNPSEVIDYICPAGSIRSFVENKITGQDLINQSIVLVNGIRIGLNLQLVE